MAWDGKYGFRQGGTFKGVQRQLGYIAALGAHDLANPDNHPRGAIPPEEMDVVMPTFRASGVQWAAQPMGRRKR